MKTRTSVIWIISKKSLATHVKSSNTFSDILKYFGLDNKGSNYKTLKKRLNEENIDYSHIAQGLSTNKGRKFFRELIPLNKILVKNSSYARKNLKQRLLKEGKLQEICAICRMGPIWMDKPLSLQLDHINGISNDNRIENLQMLCPNCHSQTDTFAGKRFKKLFWCKCGKTISRKSNRCKKCSAKRNGYKRRKVKVRPSKETLLELCSQIGYNAVGKRFGVSSNTIRKWLK